MNNHASANITTILDIIRSIPNLSEKELDLPLGQYVIFGSGPLGVRNFRKMSDLDLLVKPGLWQDLIKKYPLLDNGKSGYLKIGSIEIFSDWLPWLENVDELIDTAEIIKGFPFAKLEWVLKWKKMVNRDKDQEDIKIIEEYLRNNG